MAETTRIEWADATFNPWLGCTKVSPACDHCYAEAFAKRTGMVKWGAGEARKRTSERYWSQPGKWDDRARIGGKPIRVFCASLADVFDEEVPKEWRRDLFNVIATTPNLIWMLLTKRPNVALKVMEMLPPLPNVWLGTTVENQAMADLRVPLLLQVPAAKRFLSCEPLLGPVDAGRFLHPRSRPNADGYGGDHGPGWTTDFTTLDWVIAGGESGSGARPSHPDWFRSLRDQCADAGVPFFFKQWGEWMPTSGVDAYCHGPERRSREFPNAPGIAWLTDGRLCLQDFTVAEHAERMRTGQAYSTRAIEVDQAALDDFHASIRDEKRPVDNPLGYQWMYRVGKKRAGRLLDGREHSGVPQ